MMFPLAKAAVVSTTALLAFGLSAPSAMADYPPGPPRHVKYTVWTERPYLGAEIYYRDVDPPNFAEYSHNPYAFSPNVEADLGPGQMWTMDVMLADPDHWAMVTATSLDSPQTPNFH